MKEADRRRVPESGWLAFLEGRNPGFPKLPPCDFATIRRKVEAMRKDTTTPDTRLADDPMAFNPATVATWCSSRWVVCPPSIRGRFCMPGAILRPGERRPGLPDDVAALVDSLGDRSTSLTLVNLSERTAEADRAVRRLRRAPL